MTQVKASDRLLAAMAYNRSQFKDKVEEKVGGALLEHYKASLARLHRQTRWILHWEAEVDRLLDTELIVVLLHSIRGFKDRRKACGEVLAHLRSVDGSYRAAAGRIVARDYGLRKLDTPITDEVTEPFFDRVQQIIDAQT